MKSQGKTIFFQGQGKVSEFCTWSGKFWNSAQSQGRVVEIYIILDIIRFSFKSIKRLNKRVYTGKPYNIQNDMSFPDFEQKFQISLTKCKIHRLFPDLEKKLFFPDFSLTVATLT